MGVARLFNIGSLISGFGVPTAVVAGLLAMVAVPSGVQAATLEGDFISGPSHSNTSSDTWQYFSVPDVNALTGTASYTLLPYYDANFFGTPFPAWAAADDTIPVVGTTGGTAFAHPFLGTVGVAAAYVVPATGLYNVSLAISDFDPSGGDGFQWWLHLNDGTVVGNLLDSGTLANGGSDSFSASSLALTAGDYLYIVVGNGGNNNADNDLTAINFSINAVPEPTLPLVGGLVMGVCGMRRRTATR